jgi:twitching motility two-component system response regulator PilH
MKKKILTVDDEYQTREIIATILEENGYAPLTAKNGKEALKMMKEESPDLIVLDVLMPEKSGIKLYRELKTTETLKKIPVVICSGIARRTFLRTHIAPSQRNQEKIMEPEGYMEKPVRPDALAKIIKELLD